MPGWGRTLVSRGRVCASDTPQLVTKNYSIHLVSTFLNTGGKLLLTSLQPVITNNWGGRREPVGLSINRIPELINKSNPLSGIALSSLDHHALHPIRTHFSSIPKVQHQHVPSTADDRCKMYPWQSQRFRQNIQSPFSYIQISPTPGSHHI